MFDGQHRPSSFAECLTLPSFWLFYNFTSRNMISAFCSFRPAAAFTKTFQVFGCIVFNIPVTPHCVACAKSCLAPKTNFWEMFMLMRISSVLDHQMIQTSLSKSCEKFQQAAKFNSLKPNHNFTHSFLAVVQMLISISCSQTLPSPVLFRQRCQLDCLPHFSSSFVAVAIIKTIYAVVSQ